MSLPIGTIVIWSSTIATIPKGWQKCDGTNGTPDLSAHYPMGAGSDSDVGIQGGAATHTHSIAATGSGSIASHEHFFSGSVGSGGTGTLLAGGTVSLATGGHSHFFSNDTGSASSSHTHGTDDAESANGEPPFVRYLYIMKVSE
jgi:hypothetical protein